MLTNWFDIIEMQIYTVIFMHQHSMLPATTERFIFENSDEQRNAQNYVLSSFLSASPQAFCTTFWTQPENYAACNDPVHIHTSSQRSAHKSDCLIVFSAAKKQGGYNAVRWRDTDKRLARSRRHHPSVAFTLRAIPTRFARLIGIAEPAGFCLAILSVAVSCKKENIRNRVLQFRREMNALVNNRALGTNNCSQTNA